MSSAVTALPRYLRAVGIMKISVPEPQAERKPWRNLFLRAHAPPHWRCFRIRIARRQQQLRLMRLQCFRWLRAGGPPLETSFRQSLRGDPEPLPVIRQDPDCSSAAAAEDKQTAGKRIGIQFLAAELSEGVDALSGVDGFNRHQYPQLRGDLNQERRDDGYLKVKKTRGPWEGSSP